MAKEMNHRAIERITKGFASHRRLQMLELLKREPGLSILDISGRLRIGYENTSDHVRKLAIAGLVYKHNEGASVRHTLTPRAESVLVFCKTLL